MRQWFFPYLAGCLLARSALDVSLARGIRVVYRAVEASHGVEPIFSIRRRGQVVRLASELLCDNQADVSGVSIDWFWHSQDAPSKQRRPMVGQCERR